MNRAVTVRLTSGPIRGHRADGYLSFQGIPYAAPPVGERRWRAPASVVPWTDVRDATVPGNPAPQPGTAFGEASRIDEDCLTLDVTASETPGNGRGRPVMVWLHGGGGTSGTSAHYAAHRLVAEDVVVVAPNFRLGVFGYFGHPGLPDGGTFAVQDQQAVLRWVRREIDRFGGDPDNVTLFGESHGALAVAAHLTAPGSAGLFHRAILQSGFGMTGPAPAHTFVPGVPALPSRWTPLAELERLGAATVVERGWVPSGADPDAALERLRRLPAEELLQVTDAFIRPAYGGRILPESPAEALPAGRFHRMPVLLGTTRDEARFFVGLFADLAGQPVTAERYPRLIAEAFGDRADEVAGRYPLADYATPSLAWARIATDRVWALPTWGLGRALAGHAPTWCYEFADPDAPLVPPLPGMPTGAQHASELSYLFDMSAAVTHTDDQTELAARMRRSWTAFARNGDPAIPEWPAWPVLGTGHVQGLLPGAVGATDYVADHQLDFWAGGA